MDRHRSVSSTLGEDSFLLKVSRQKPVRQSPLQKTDGFVIPLFLLLLPVLLSAGAALFLLYGWIEEQSSAKNRCRAELVLGMERTALSLKALLALNPQATSLEKRYQVAIATAATAAAAGQWALAERATATASKIRSKQKILHQSQQVLIFKGQESLRQAQVRAIQGIRESHRLMTDLLSLRSSAVHLAVRPKTYHPAPIYELESPFEKNQALAQSWQSAFSLYGPLKNFMNIQGRIKNQCAITLSSADFRAQIIGDKFLSKPSSFSSF